MTISIKRCSNCNTLPQQKQNIKTKRYSIKCPECKVKTEEYKTIRESIIGWNSINNRDTKSSKKK